MAPILLLLLMGNWKVQHLVVSSGIISIPSFIKICPEVTNMGRNVDITHAYPSFEEKYVRNPPSRMW
jgi:hypothetical protein